MCTAMHIHGLFGRTLDLEYGYGEQPVLCPRDFPLAMRHLPDLPHHHAMLGMAAVVQGFPLYYDAINEYGLGMAGLHFPHSGQYAPTGEVASFELIPYVLGTCTTVEEAKALLAQVRVCDTPFSPDYPPTKLHWMVADERQSIVVEPTAEGLQIYDNPVGVMTNEPPFPRQLAHWADFAALTNREPTPTPPHLGRGSGSVGLPGDFTSPSRFVRAAFVAAHSEEGGDPVAHFFHAIAAVAVPRGCVQLSDDKQVWSRYTSCMDPVQRMYHYSAYEDRQIHSLTLQKPNGEALITFPPCGG